MLVEAMSPSFKRVRNLGQGRGRKDSKREQDSGPKDGAVASPAPPVTPSTGTLRLPRTPKFPFFSKQTRANVQPQSPKQGNVEDSTKASSNVTKPHVPP